MNPVEVASVNPDELISGIHNVQLAVLVIAGTAVAWFAIVALIDSLK